RRGGRQLDVEGAIAVAGHALDPDAFALERGLEVFGGALGLVLDGLARIDAEDEVDATLEIETEVDALLGRIQRPERRDDDGGHEADANPEISTHPSRLAPPRRAQRRRGRRSLTPDARCAPRPSPRR